MPGCFIPSLLTQVLALQQKPFNRTGRRWVGRKGKIASPWVSHLHLLARYSAEEPHWVANPALLQSAGMPVCNCNLVSSCWYTGVQMRIMSHSSGSSQQNNLSLTAKKGPLKLSRASVFCHWGPGLSSPCQAVLFVCVHSWINCKLIMAAGTERSPLPVLPQVIQSPGRHCLPGLRERHRKRGKMFLAGAGEGAAPWQGESGPTGWAAVIRCKGRNWGERQTKVGWGHAC